MFKYGWSDLDFSVVDLGNDLSGVLLVDSAAEGKASAQDLLDCSCEILGHWFLVHDLGDFLDLLESKVALVGDIFDFLSVSLVASELLDKESGWARLDCDFCGSVLALQLNHNSDSFPLGSFLDDIFTNLFGVLDYERYTRPRGPSLGARVAAGPGSPPKTLMLTE